MQFALGQNTGETGSPIVLAVDGINVAQITVTARKTTNFKGEKTNLETIVMVGDRAVVINTPIAVPETEAAPKKPAKTA
jgi:hypothetical protein